MLNAVSGIDPSGIFSTLLPLPGGTIMAAVSGGSDSLALLMLVKAYLDHRGADTRIVAVTVDHGLRAESTQEARAVASMCSAHGIEHRTVRWTEAKPSSGIPAAAREARYRLLAEVAAVEGADLMMTGHTLDDQLETVAMRRERGEGRGLAGMAPATLYDGRIWIVRPLLGQRRAALRDYLSGRGIPWIDDPSNSDRRYERVRVRQAAGAGEVDASEAQIAAAAAERVAAGRAAAALLSATARLAAPGLVAIDRAFAGADAASATYALRMVLAAVGGTEQLPDAERSASLFGRLGRENFRITLARAVVDARRDASFLRRESRGLPDPGIAPDGIWDGRYRLPRLLETVVAAVGPEQAGRMIENGEVDAKTAPGTPPSLAGMALAAEPALWRGDRFLGLAQDIGTARRIIAPWARFLPSFDLAPARALARLLDADIPPLPPFAGHIDPRA